MSIDSTQRKLILGIFGATLAICAILVADLGSGGRPDPPALRVAALLIVLARRSTAWQDASLRMRMMTIEPGGVFGPGVGWPEDRSTRHWLENRGTIPAMEISVDIIRSA